jgi:hypothetical protein
VTENRSRRFAADVCRFLMLGGAMLLVVAQVRAAPSQETMTRCAAYAERAVQQFNAMNNTPQCHVDPSLRWQPNYDNHYNGCLVLPEFMSNSEETVRVTHLKACGAQIATPTSASATPTAPTGMQLAGSEVPADAGLNAATPQASGNTAAASGACRPDNGTPATVLNKEKRQAEFSGTAYVLAGGNLTYTDRDTHKRLTYAIARPGYYVN